MSSASALSTQVQSALELGLTLTTHHPEVHAIAFYDHERYGSVLSVQMNTLGSTVCESGVDLAADYLGDERISGSEVGGPQEYVRWVCAPDTGLPVRLSSTSRRQLATPRSTAPESITAGYKFAKFIGDLALPVAEASICFTRPPRGYLELNLRSPNGEAEIRRLLGNTLLYGTCRRVDISPPIEVDYEIALVHGMTTALAVNDFLNHSGR